MDAKLLPLLLWTALGGSPATRGGGAHEAGGELVRGVTISCQTWGWEWGTAGFDAELARLAELGANWVAIHPYAAIRADGGVRPTGGELDPARPPDWLRVPIEAAHARGMSILIKPHLAYWGSPFRWRGEIRFDEPAARERFWEEYGRWIVALAEATRTADGFVVGTETDLLLGEEARWRALVGRVRERTDAHLTYAANWDRFEEVPFWDALDAIGVQAYFPLSDEAEPEPEHLRAAWARVLERLRTLHRRTGKPVVFTELGYDASAVAAREPWRPGRDRAGHGAPERERTEGERRLQALLLRTSLEVVDGERAWLRGAFLWKWFVGAPDANDHAFHLDRPALAEAIRGVWR